MSPDDAARQPVALPGPHPAALPVVLVGVFLGGLDFFIVNVAIPAISRRLHSRLGRLRTGAHP
ncbi:hypothetical protein [Streptomyces beijiangensis]|uniref:MFS transporter n=1 Tax=Streptomyces beijiangensis TaxID=163361 RepID=A0A939JE43_9ACTN|nr:hypothetical protein [Streptomyces beijiangensis]MBO0510933.1 hypothetical protein [Streptomyces beijiangensis]